MSDLDKKLEEALQPWIDEIQSEYGTGINDDKKPQFIAFANAKLQIKQAFIDAGWREEHYVGPDSLLPLVEYSREQLEAISKEWSKPRMTGQEWYDRFERNLKYDTKSYSRQCEDCGAPHNWEEAAKKAAGIE